MVSEPLDHAAKPRADIPSSTATTWPIVLLCMIPAVAYYAILICGNYGDFLRTPNMAGPSLFSPVNYGLTLNSMLLHLLDGSFDIDPQAIGLEGVQHNGRTYAYFGIVIALIRLPFLFARDFATTDYTRLSCLVAVSIMGSFNLASLLTVWRAVGRPHTWPLFVLMILGVLFSGAQIQFLMASLWQEVCLWAAAFAAICGYLIIRGYYSARGFTPLLLTGLAGTAGLCLLTRVSTAAGLYAALGLLIVALLARAWRKSGSEPRLVGIVTPFLPALLVLVFFILVAAGVNYGRWGNPFTFTGDIHSYPLATPAWLVRDAQYGNFNLIRMGYGLAYYFVPLWAMQGPDGGLLWSEFQQRTIHSVELPPASFFLSDPLLIGLAGFALFQLVRHRKALDRGIAISVLAGLLLPIILILSFSSTTFRYRLEFYPFLNLCAFLGLGALLSRPRHVPLVPIAVAAVVGVVGSHMFWLLYALGRYGDATERLAGMDVISFYRSFFQ
jgi:hypothetical protein